MTFTYSCTRNLFWFFFRTSYGLKIYGQEHLPEGGAILAPNHTSFFDPPIVGSSCKEQVHFLARSTLFTQPILKYFLPRLNTHPLSGTGADFSSFKTVLQLLKEQKKVVIFPEGIRAPTEELLPLKAGVVLLAQRAHCPIVPIYIDGAFAIWSRHRRFPKPWGRLACCFGSPIFPKEGESKEDLLERLQESMLCLRSWYREGAVGVCP